MSLREQTGAWIASQSSPTYTGHHAGLHPEDIPSSTNDLDNRRTVAQQKIQYDDREPPRLPSSTRRYQSAIQPATPRTIVRFTHHQGKPPAPPIQRASRLKPQTEEPHPIPVSQKSTHRTRPHLLVYIGLCLCIMLIGWMLFGALANWVQVKADDLRYGYPRTFQTDADVGHGGISHFTVENLQGHILITEVQLDHPDKGRLYLCCTLTGAHADLLPATVSFEDVNHDGSLAMLVIVDNTKHAFRNLGKDGFQVPTSG